MAMSLATRKVHILSNPHVNRRTNTNRQFNQPPAPLTLSNYEIRCIDTRRGAHYCIRLRRHTRASPEVLATQSQLGQWCNQISKYRSHSKRLMTFITIALMPAGWPSTELLQAFVGWCCWSDCVTVCLRYAGRSFEVILADGLFVVV